MSVRQNSYMSPFSSLSSTKLDKSRTSSSLYCLLEDWTTFVLFSGFFFGILKLKYSVEYEIRRTEFAHVRVKTLVTRDWDSLVSVSLGTICSVGGTQGPILWLESLCFQLCNGTWLGQQRAEGDEWEVIYVIGRRRPIFYRAELKGLITGLLPPLVLICDAPCLTGFIYSSHTT